MKRNFLLNKLIFLFLIYAPFSIGQQSLAPIKFIESEKRSGNIDVTHILLDLRFNWEEKQAFGTAIINLTPLSKTSKINLDAAWLTIQSVEIQDHRSLNFSYAGGEKDDGLAIALDRVYNTGEALTIKIKYHTNWVNKADPNNIWGSFGKGIRFHEPTSTTPIKRRQIWSSGEPESNRFWFPCHDVPGDLRTTEFIATVEKNLTVIANGSLIETNENDDGTHSFHYKTDHPYPNHLTSFVVGEYVDIKQSYKDKSLHTYGYADEKAAIEATTVRLPDMVRFFSEFTGMEYPYKQYSQVAVQDYPFPGLTGQHTSTIISDNMIDDFRTHADFFYLWDGVEAHALASQWFGNLLTPRSWDDIWLSESFCHYSDGLYSEYINGHDEFLSYYLNPDQNTVLNDWNSGYRHPIVTSDIQSLESFTADNYVKIRGSLVLGMLRKQLGDALWFKSIQAYVKTYSHKQVTTEDFRRSIEMTTGKTLKWFFDQWIYQIGRPVFEVAKNYNKINHQLVLQVNQVQKQDSMSEHQEIKFFQGKIEIEIDGTIHEVWLKPERENKFVFKAVQDPKLVHFDYENTWIKEFTFYKSTEELLYQVSNDKSILGRWWAIDELIKVVKDENSSLEIKPKIYEALRSTISGNSYWRLRLYAMNQLRNVSAFPLDETTKTVLLHVIGRDTSWLRTGAIAFLGMTKDSAFADIYLHALNDKSDRVINAAANALGKTKSSKAYDALVTLKDKPSWKNQSMISALNGLKELGDPRGMDIAIHALLDVHSPRWFLATPVWDYPVAAAETLVSLKKEEMAYSFMLERFKKSILDEDYNDIFSNVLLITTLADPRSQEVFDLLRTKFKEDANAMIAVEQYEALFKEKLNKAR